MNQHTSESAIEAWLAAGNKKTVCPTVCLMPINGGRGLDTEFTGEIKHQAYAWSQHTTKAQKSAPEKFVSYNKRMAEQADSRSLALLEEIESRTGGSNVPAIVYQCIRDIAAERWVVNSTIAQQVVRGRAVRARNTRMAAE